MKRIMTLLAVLTILLCGCGKTEEISVLYSPENETVLTGCHRTSGLALDGSYAYSKSGYDSEGRPSGGTWLVRNGEEIRLSSANAERIRLGERGVYTIEPSPENLSEKHFVCYGYDGTKTASVPAADIGPEGANGNYPGDHENLGSVLPMTETEDGVFVLWGSYLIALTEDLTVISSEKLPGLGFGVFSDGDTWVLCRVKKEMQLVNLTTGEVYQVPARFYGTGVYAQAQICTVHDGYAYAWDQYGVFRWTAADSADPDNISVTEIADFTGSGVPGSMVTLCGVFFEDGITLSVRWAEAIADGERTALAYHLASLKPAETSESCTVLELAHALNGSRISEQVIAFNRTHTDVKITVNDYSRFARADDLSAGATRLRMDLETGILTPDILLLNDRQFAEMTDGMQEYFRDLIPYMTGDVKPEDLWGCVMSSADNGALLGIGGRFTLESLAGRRNSLPDGDSWTFEEALCAASASEGAAFVKDLTRSGAQNLFLRYQREHFRQADVFASAEFEEFTAWVQSLPESAGAVQTGPTAADVLAGMAESAPEAENGIYPYISGQILLAESRMNSAGDYLSVLNTFGALPGELKWIGYPTDEASGTLLTFGEILTIPSCSDVPEKAWKFVETVLLSAGEMPDEQFTSLRQPYEEYMKELEGMEMFFAHAGIGMRGRDLHEKYRDGGIDGLTGSLYTFDSAAAEELGSLLESPCMTAEALTDSALEAIIREEQERDGTPDDITEAIRSRAAIYLAEKQ